MSTATLDPTAVRRWKRYPEYRAARTETLTQIPSHWRMNRLKYVTRINPDVLGDETDPDYELQYIDISNVDSLGRVHELQTMRFEGAPSRARRRVRHGDVIISTVRTYLRAITAIENPPENLLVSTGFAVLRAGAEYDPRFLYRLIQSGEFVEAVVNHSEGVGYPAINPTELGCLPVWLPPLAEQRAIAAFLDRETARIDALIARKERLIELLEEKRQAVISHAVSGEPSQPFVQLKYYIDILAGFAFPSDGFSHDPDDVRLLRGTNVVPGATDWSEAVRWPRSDTAIYHEYALQAGDIVFGMDRPWIKSGIRVARVKESDLPSLLLQRVARLRARNNLSQGYLELLLSSKQFTAYFEPLLTGISVPHISSEQIAAFRFRLPTPTRPCGQSCRKSLPPRVLCRNNDFWPRDAECLVFLVFCYLDRRSVHTA